MKPINVDVVTNVLTVLSHCHSCRLIFCESGVEGEIAKEVLNEYPKELQEEFLQLSDWMRDLARLYRHRIRIRVIDAKSLLGIYKSLRHRFRKYPACIVDETDVVSGWDREKLSDLLDAHIQEHKRA